MLRKLSDEETMKLHEYKSLKNMIDMKPSDNERNSINASINLSSETFHMDIKQTLQLIILGSFAFCLTFVFIISIIPMWNQIKNIILVIQKENMILKMMK